MISPRTAAAAALAEVITRTSTLDEALARHLAELSGRDRALAREIAFGVCRRFFELDGMLRMLLQKPLKARDTDVFALLLAGMYQLRHMRVPDHAAVAETVAATRQMEKHWASGLVNAILRAFAARGPRLFEALNEAQKNSHPQWLFERLQQAWPGSYQDIITANNTAPEMTLRINLAGTTRNDWLAAAQSHGIAARTCSLSPAGVRLEQPANVDQLPGFAAGQLSVQDQAAQLAALLLPCETGHRVLDACAAPGGKACHLLEHTDGIDLLALDSNAQRQHRVLANLERLGLHATLVVGDAAQPDDWWDGRSFDRILVDAPCSGSGVIRRHPDIKLLRTPQQVAAAAQQQLAILSGVWRCLAPQGLLLYCTCSVLPEENESVIAAFLAVTPTAGEIALQTEFGITRRHGLQLLPRAGEHDGFYYTLLRKL